MESNLIENHRSQRSNKKVIFGIFTGFAVIGVIATIALLTSSTKISPQITETYNLDEATFRAFMLEHNKTYDSDEEYYKRFEIFLQNIAYINAVNSSDFTYKLGINKFSDLTHEEFEKFYLTTIPRKSYEGKTFIQEQNLQDLPATLDWRTKGVVSPVKDQGQCGSCWAFSTTGALESLHAITQGSLITFSEQQLVDCSIQNNNCDGGLMDLAFGYVQQFGIETEADYPYTARFGPCQADLGDSINGKKSFEKGIGYNDVKPNSEAALKQELMYGPVSVSVEAKNWSPYTGGIFDDCGDDLDHGVLVVGYTEDAWIVKNSWGEDWGENGFIRLKMGNTCGIEEQATRPTAPNNQEIRQQLLFQRRAS